MREYHFFISSLPELFFDKKGQPLNFDSYLNELKVYLHPDDFNKVAYLRYEPDNENLLKLLSEENKEFIAGGNFSKEELEQEIKSPMLCPPYMAEFISFYNNTGNKNSYAENEKKLYNLYYEFVINCNTPFLKDWFSFEFYLKNITTAILAPNLGLKPENEMIGDHSTIDEIIFYRSKNFDLNHLLPHYPKLVQILNQKDLLVRERQIDQFKWDYLNELTLFKYFTIEVILSYTLKLKILLRWENIEMEKGKNRFDNIINELQNTVNI